MIAAFAPTIRFQAHLRWATGGFTELSMRRLAIRSMPLLALPVVFLLSGCGSGTGRYEVTGTVLYDNNPLTEGVIEFWPLDGQGSKSSTVIVNGEYKIPKDQGLQPGKYKVSIICGDGFSGAGDAGKTPTKAAAKGGGTRGEERSPPEYFGATSKQTAEVTSGGVNKFDYSVPKRN
jgi:hypothetical protein